MQGRGGGGGAGSGLGHRGFIAHSHFHNCPQSNQPLLDSSRYQISLGSGECGDPQVRTGAANITDFTFSLCPPTTTSPPPEGCHLRSNCSSYSHSDCYHAVFCREEWKRICPTFSLSITRSQIRMLYSSGRHRAANSWAAGQGDWFTLQSVFSSIFHFIFHSTATRVSFLDHIYYHSQTATT